MSSTLSAATWRALQQGHDVPSLLDLVTRPAWMRDAACKEHPEVTWFPARGKDPAPAKRVCSGCLVRQECADYAASLEGRAHGIWGGLSGLDRRRARSAAAHAA